LLFFRYNLLIENKEDLATLMTVEQGKPLAEARGEVGRVAHKQHLYLARLYSIHAKRVQGHLMKGRKSGQPVVGTTAFLDTSSK
jgi:succinate-semialdehyde dehydrogenase/glutarate-semialdehyde dehydrogenase